MQTGWTSPPTLASELGITPTGVRAWLKRHGHTKDADGRYRIDPVTAAEMRAYFAARQAPPPSRPCNVAGCERARKSRNLELCALHYQRMLRRGSLEPGRPGENQRIKTHCPQGHPYTPENTYKFADGRRRCRRCRIDQVRARQRALAARD